MDAALSLDPLIAEAKQRMRRRRAALVVLLLAAGSAALTFALRPSGGAPTLDRAGQRNSTSRPLSHLVVPVDPTERQWRSSVRALRARPVVPHARAAALGFRRRVETVLRETGAVPLRITIWRRTAPMAVEVVAATRVRPAVYLRHRAIRLVHLLQSLNAPDFLRIVNAQGGRLFEWGGVSNEGFVGVPRKLYYCSPVSTWMPPPYRPCPVK